MHQFFERTYIILGGRPLSFICGYIFEFLVSGVFHNVVLIMLNASVKMWCVLLSLRMQKG